MHFFPKQATYLAIIISSVLPIKTVIAAELSQEEQKNIIHVIKQEEQNIKGIIGVALYDTESGKTWSYNGNTRFPMMSTFKTLACAKLLHDFDHNKLSLTDSVKIKASELITYSPITKKYIDTPFSLRQACAATMSTSDNTAANVILTAIGGPKALTQFIHESGDKITRLDRIEPFLNEAKDGDIRDTTTPLAMTATIERFLLGQGLTPKSREQLTTWMKSNSVAGPLLRSVLPEQWRIADRSGAGGFGSRGITAVVWPKNHKALVMSIYIKQTKSDMAERNKAIANIGKVIFSSLPHVDK